MQVPATTHRQVHFGPFTVDLASRELRNNGRKIPLQEKPFQILALLLDQPGEVVTREEFRQKLWSSDIFVDFEHGINKAVKKLREALEDHADEPRYIETLPKHGYRFIAPVAEEGPVPRTGEQQAVLRETSQVQLRRRWYALVFAAAAVVFAVLLVAFNLGGIRDRLLHGTISHQDTIVVADFSNSTGDPLFDDTLKQALSIALKQSPFLNVFPENKVAATLRRMDRPADTALTGEVIRQLCQRVGSKAYIAGSIAKLDGEYVLGLKAVDCHSGNLLAKELTTVARKEQVLDALGREAAKTRGQLGESLATVRKFDVPLAEATTSSLEALKAYSLSAKADGEKGPGAALPFDLRAVQLDPNFALAYLAAGAHYLDLAEPGRASEYFTKAFQLRAREDEREKFLITTFYYFDVTGELDKAGQVLEERVVSYPREVGAYNNLAIVYALEGQYEKAVEPNLQSLRRTPDNVAPYTSFTNTQLALQRFDEARQLIGEAHARKLDDYLPHSALYALAFLGKDSAAMADQQQWFTGKAEENLGLSLASDTEAYAGHLGKARDLTKRAADSAIQADSKETAAIWEENAGLREAAFSNATRARQAAAEGLKLAPESQGVAAEAALAFAMAGDSAKAESLAQDLDKRFPLDTQMQSLWLPAIRAQLALNRKNAAGALSLLQAATSPIELGQITFVTNLSCLYPTYIRGQAYLASGPGNSAAAEFQKILDHNGLVWNCWTELWHVWAWRARTPSQHEHRRARRPTRPVPERSPPTGTFSHFGKTPTPTSPF